jgi:anti-sigma factor RsiW
MPNCKKLDPFVTPYVDGELDAPDRAELDAHLCVCPPCHSRVAAERIVRELIQSRQPALRKDGAPEALRARCADLTAELKVRPRDSRSGGPPRSSTPSARARLTSLALAASLVVLVGGAFLYELTDRSVRVMAAELTADHVKCFGLNRVLGTHQDAAAVEGAIGSSFGWHVRLPDRPDRAGLELVGARPCLYGEGRVAHIMYHHNGRPVSVFMLPKTARPDEVVEVMGHEAAIWSLGDRTFVLIAREPRAEVERMASFVQAGLR